MESITKSSWNCPICMEIMDGEKNGVVAISKRCFHVFHKVCIENWINEGSRNCPSCRLKNISVQEIILNPDYEKQCKKYLSNPENYSYKKAFDEEYHHSDSTIDSSDGEENLKPQDILRPRILRGAERREDLNEQEARILLEETSKRMDSLIVSAKKKNLGKERASFYQSQDLVLSNIQKKLERDLEHLETDRFANYYLIPAVQKRINEIEAYRNRFRDFLGSNSTIEEVIYRPEHSIELEKLSRPILPIRPDMSQGVNSTNHRYVLKVAIFAIRLIVLYKVARSKFVTNYIHKYSKLNLKRS